jgi:hypothetical protein
MCDVPRSDKKLEKKSAKVVFITLIGKRVRNHINNVQTICSGFLATYASGIIGKRRTYTSAHIKDVGLLRDQQRNGPPYFSLRTWERYQSVAALRYRIFKHLARTFTLPGCSYIPMMHNPSLRILSPVTVAFMGSFQFTRIVFHKERFELLETNAAAAVFVELIDNSTDIVNAKV